MTGIKNKAGIIPTLGLAAGALVLPFMSAATPSPAKAQGIQYSDDFNLQQGGSVLTDSMKALMNRIKDDFFAPIEMLKIRAGNTQHIIMAGKDFNDRADTWKSPDGKQYEMFGSVSVTYKCGSVEKAARKIFEKIRSMNLPQDRLDIDISLISANLPLADNIYPTGLFTIRQSNGAGAINKIHDALKLRMGKMALEEAILIMDGDLSMPPAIPPGRFSFTHRNQCGIL